MFLAVLFLLAFLALCGYLLFTAPLLGLILVLGFGRLFLRTFRKSMED